MVDYSWFVNGTNSHFMIGYKGSQKDGGDTASWPMLYNALWFRVLGFDGLLPQSLLDTMRDWYSHPFSSLELLSPSRYSANAMQKYGLPLNSRKLYTKDDWMTFLAATYYTSGSEPVPSSFSSRAPVAPSSLSLGPSAREIVGPVSSVSSIRREEVALVRVVLRSSHASRSGRRAAAPRVTGFLLVEWQRF